MGPHVGGHQWSQTHSCLQGMLKSTCTPPEVWGRALPPIPLRGITPRGAPCPCSQSAFGHAVGSAPRLWLSCAEGSQMDRAMPTPGRRGSACPQTRDASFTPPALLLALGSHPANPQHSHPTAVGLGETLHWGKWDPHHIAELPNTPAEHQRCGSHPKGPRAPKRRLRPEHEPWAPYKSGRLQRAHLHPHLTVRGSSTPTPAAWWTQSSTGYSPEPQLSPGLPPAALTHRNRTTARRN